ncbi:MAG: putative metallo-hydrolase [Actinobacteria bacterium ADurb.Bin346]|nr:MAG: putative metallo-hydrolase [Actinobacteria bacterium ADurb.Bin346]
MKVKKLILGFYSVNCYVVTLQAGDEDFCFIIDPGADFNSIKEYLTSEKIYPEFILNSHGHYDHIAAVPELQDYYEIPFYINEDEEPLLKDPEKNMSSLLGSNTLLLKTYTLIDKNVERNLNKMGIIIHKTPGHTPGSISIEAGDNLFTGDLLFRGGAGRTDLPGGDQSLLVKSLAAVKSLDKNFIINPGHGATTTLENEINNNFYMSNEFLKGGGQWF